MVSLHINISFENMYILVIFIWMTDFNWKYVHFSYFYINVRLQLKIYTLLLFDILMSDFNSKISTFPFFYILIYHLNWKYVHFDYFHMNDQDIPIMQERYQDLGDRNFLDDYCWCLKHDVMAAEHRRKSLKTPFTHE